MKCHCFLLCFSSLCTVSNINAIILGGFKDKMKYLLSMCTGKNLIISENFFRFEACSFTKNKIKLSRQKESKREGIQQSNFHTWLPKKSKKINDPFHRNMVMRMSIWNEFHLIRLFAEILFDQMLRVDIKLVIGMSVMQNCMPF